MSIFVNSDSGSLLLYTLVADDPDFQHLRDTDQLRTIMPAYITIEDVFRRVGWQFTISGRDVVIGPPDHVQTYRDDVLFSKTLSLLDGYALQGYDFPSRMLSGGRVLVPLMDIYNSIDIAMVDAVVDFVSPYNAAKYAKARRAVEALGPPNDETKLDVLSKWNKYFGVVAKVFAFVRASGPVMVEPTKGFGKQETVAALLDSGPFGHVVPMQGTEFSEQEKFMITLFQAKRPAKIVHDGIKEVLVCPFDALAAIGASEIETPLPVIPQVVPETLAAAIVPLPEAACQVNGVAGISTESPEEMLWELCSSDLNSRKDLHRLLVAGGRTSEARDLWASFSSAAKASTSRLIPKEWASFPEIMAKFSEVLEVELGTPGLDECVAARLLCIKGSVAYDTTRRRVRRKF